MESALCEVGEVTCLEDACPGVKDEIKRLNESARVEGATFKVGGGPKDTKSSPPRRRMLGRRPDKSLSVRYLFSNAISNAGPQTVPTPRRALSASSLSLRAEIEATTPSREVVVRSVTSAKGRPFLDDTEQQPTTPEQDEEKSGARNENEQTVSASTTPSLIKRSPDRRLFRENPPPRDAFQMLEKKLEHLEATTSAAQLESEESATRETETKLKLDEAETNVKHLSARVVFLKNQVSSCKAQIAERDGTIANHVEAISVDSSADSEKSRSVAAALYVDVERLAEELQETKKALSNCKLEAMQSDLENKKVFDEMFKAASDVADELENERVSSAKTAELLAQTQAELQTATEQLANLKTESASLHNQLQDEKKRSTEAFHKALQASLLRETAAKVSGESDQVRLTELVETKAERSLVKASLRGESQKVSDQMNESTSNRQALRTLETENRNLKTALDDAKASNKDLESKANSTCSALAGARTKCAFAESAIEAVETKRDFVEKMLREEIEKLTEGTVSHAQDLIRGTGAAVHAHTLDTNKGQQMLKGLGRWVVFFGLVVGVCCTCVVIHGLSTFLLDNDDDEVNPQRCTTHHPLYTALDELLSGTIGTMFRRNVGCGIVGYQVAT